MIAITLAAVALFAQEDAFQLASPFTDHMVLQRETDAAIWGVATPGAVVTLAPSWSEDVVTTTAEESGAWRARLATPAAGGPFTINASSDSGARVELADVLIGEVWICSGQSNMEWPMTAIDDAEFEIKSSNHPRIRMFDVPHHVSMEPRSTCSGTWMVATPETVRSFSAVGLLFGRNLEEALDVPIGLIGSNWGGTPAEAWTSAKTLRSEFPEFDPVLDRAQEALANPGEEDSLSARRAKFWDVIETAAESSGWAEASAKTETWRSVQLPGDWDAIDLGGFDGVVWYRKEFELSGDAVNGELQLHLGPIDDMDLTWFNGTLVGESRTDGLWNKPRNYSIPSGLAQPGTNWIVIAAVDTGGAGRVGVSEAPMQLVDAGGKQLASLSGDWVYRTGVSLAQLGGWPRGTWFNQNSPSALSNGMLEPLIPYSIRGAIWYQGESNRTRAAQYRRLFPAMITDWRTRWGQGDFPFYFVQIAPFNYGGDKGQAAELREAQMMTQSLANTGMAVTMDIGNPRDIHPRNKQDVALRLALLARAETYGEQGLVAHGPQYTSLAIEGSKIRLRFDHAQGLTSGEETPRTFTIAGEDKVFHEAHAHIEGETILVWSDTVPKPVAVRFAWGAADEPNLWNGAGLPSSSFRTDDWER